MLYEVRTYTFTVGGAGEAVEDFGKIIEEQRRLSPLIGFFQAEIGDLNRILHIWEYEDSAHRESVRAEAQAKPWWPPLRVEKILHQQTRLMRAAPFCPRPLSGDFGGVYEIRSDTLITGGMEGLAAGWARHLPERENSPPSPPPSRTRRESSSRASSTNSCTSGPTATTPTGPRWRPPPPGCRAGANAPAHA